MGISSQHTRDTPGIPSQHAAAGYCRSLPLLPHERVKRHRWVRAVVAWRAGAALCLGRTAAAATSWSLRGISPVVPTVCQDLMAHRVGGPHPDRVGGTPHGAPPTGGGRKEGRSIIHYYFAHGLMPIPINNRA